MFMKLRFASGAVFPDKEKAVIQQMLEKATPTGANPLWLDVGCGYGRNLRQLSRPGLSIIGVDANSDAVEQNRSKGFECYLPDDNRWGREYDCMLMSHIIEHFSPPDLIRFMEGYLTYLKPGGALVIATPLLTDYFFDDFTHVKPYHPESILMIFGEGNHQVNMQSSAMLELRDLWFRTSAYKVRWVRTRYLGKFGKVLVKAINAVFALLHLASFGLLGKKDGWVGVFQKVG